MTNKEESKDNKGKVILIIVLVLSLLAFVSADNYYLIIGNSTNSSCGNCTGGNNTYFINNTYINQTTYNITNITINADLTDYLNTSRAQICSSGYASKWNGSNFTCVDVTPVGFATITYVDALVASLVNITYYSDEIYINKVNNNNFTFNESKLNNTIENLIPLSASYFLDNRSSDISGKRTLALSQNSTPVNITYSALAIGTTELTTFCTQSGVPNVDFIPDGIYHVHFHAYKTVAITNSIRIYANLTRWNGSKEIVMGRTEFSEILGTDTASEFDIHSTLPKIIINTTDRICVKFIADVTNTAGGAPTVIFSFQDITSAGIETPSNFNAVFSMFYTKTETDFKLSEKVNFTQIDNDTICRAGNCSINGSQITGITISETDPLSIHKSGGIADYTSNFDWNKSFFNNVGTLVVSNDYNSYFTSIMVSLGNDSYGALQLASYGRNSIGGYIYSLNESSTALFVEGDNDGTAINISKGRVYFNSLKSTPGILTIDSDGKTIPVANWSSTADLTPAYNGIELNKTFILTQVNNGVNINATATLAACSAQTSGNKTITDNSIIGNSSALTANLTAYKNADNNFSKQLSCPSGQFYNAVDSTNRNYTCGTPASSGGSSPFNTSGTNVFMNDSSWKFGIGTSTPRQKLEVVGGINTTSLTDTELGSSLYTCLLGSYENGTIYCEGREYKKTSITTTTALTYSDVTGLVIPVTSGQLYDLVCHFIYRTAATTTGINITANYPAMVNISSSWEIFGYAAAGTDTTWECFQTASGFAGRCVTIQAVSATTDYGIEFTSNFKPITTGLFNFSIASEVSGSGVWIQPGSTCIIS